MLGVSSNTLRSWERRYGFPRPHRSTGGHRYYELFEIEALRETLIETNNVASAVALAQQRGAGPSSSARLNAAYSAFNEELADHMLEESLALRSVERTIEEVLLPAVADEADQDIRTASFEFAWRHATAWLAALKRLSPPPTRKDGVLMLESWAACDLDTLHGQALELVLRRGGLRTLALTPVIDRSRLDRALKVLDPRAIVLTGATIKFDEIARLVYAVRSIFPSALVFDYRGTPSGTSSAANAAARRTPTAARDELLRRLDALAAAAAASSGPAQLTPARSIRL
jgi:DNA-binding transcriptional MerR regulator